MLEMCVTIARVGDNKYCVWFSWPEKQYDTEYVDYLNTQSWIAGIFNSFDAATNACLQIKGIEIMGGIKSAVE